MPRLTFSVSLSSILLLTACNPIAFFRTSPPEAAPAAQESTATRNSSRDAVMEKKEKEVMATQNGVYVGYNEGVIGNGQVSVLFFRASWCGECKESDEDLTDWYSRGGDNFLNVYEVDYDTSTELKQRYGVTYQHTFVKIDGQGNALEVIQGPSKKKLMEFVQR